MSDFVQLFADLRRHEELSSADCFFVLRVFHPSQLASRGSVISKRPAPEQALSACTAWLRFDQLGTSAGEVHH